MSNGLTNNLPISPDLMEILRDPYALLQGGQYGPDPGRLTLVHGTWLVSEDTGYKYPIRNGIPVMLVEEGARWKDTPVDALPVPPPPADPPAQTTTLAAGSASSESAASRNVNPIFLILGGIAVFSFSIWLFSRLFGDDDDDSAE